MHCRNANTTWHIPQFPCRVAVVWIWTLALVLACSCFPSNGPQAGDSSEGAILWRIVHDSTRKARLSGVITIKSEGAEAKMWPGMHPSECCNAAFTACSILIGSIESLLRLEGDMKIFNFCCNQGTEKFCEQFLLFYKERRFFRVVMWDLIRILKLYWVECWVGAHVCVHLKAWLQEGRKHIRYVLTLLYTPVGGSYIFLTVLEFINLWAT